MEITLTDEGSGTIRFATSSRGGRFAFLVVPPGEYRLLFEQFGYRPLLLRGVAVDPGHDLDLRITLKPAILPVRSAEVRNFWGSGVAEAVLRSDPRLAHRDLPDRSRQLSELLRQSSVSEEGGTIEGLPSSLNGTVLDGIPYATAQHPRLPGSELGDAALPLSAFRDADLITDLPDVEWSEAAGARLSAYSRRGSSTLKAEWFGDWSGPQTASSKYFDTSSIPGGTFRGGFLAGTPVVRNSQALFGVEAERLAAPRPPVWPDSPERATLIATARDSFGVDLASSAEPHEIATYLISGFGRFDWQLSSHHALNFRASFSSLSIENADLGANAMPTLGAKISGPDLSTATTMTSLFGESLMQEVRIAFERSNRNYRSMGLPGTTIASDGFAFGDDPSLPGSFRRVGLRGSETLHYSSGRHQVKVGFEFSRSWFEQSFGTDRAGRFFFSDVAAFAARQGAYQQATGSGALADFSIGQFAGFAQEIWSPAPGLDFLVGIRYERETLPKDRVALNRTWLALTGLANMSMRTDLAKFSPRAGIRWDPDGRHRWLFDARAGVFYGMSDPGLLGELISEDGGTDVRRGVGALASWPSPPGPAAVPYVASRLTLVGPDFQPPRSRRASFGLSRSLGGGGAIHLSGAYRHTDFLPRRRDLNLLPAATGTDQYRRPIYGSLIKEGGLLVADPGSNRRFPGFDAVSALSVDGSSDYYGGTASAEHPLGGFGEVFASYTISWTTDNWLAANGGGDDAQLSPFPFGLGGSDWADGRSDLDVPHSVVAGFETRGSFLSFAGFYRYHSGTPFTVGFRDGVDANADGSAVNDVAFVDDTLPGMAALLDQWSCLKGDAGRFAKRNACRGPGVHSLDVRLGLGPLRVGPYRVSLIIDGLNLIESELGVPDRALYLVDASKALTTDPATGVTSIPLIVNSGFGRPLYRRTPGRAVRFAFRLTY